MSMLTTGPQGQTPYAPEAVTFTGRQQRPTGHPCGGIMAEQWKPVVGLEEYYEISSEGRVRTKPRVVMFGGQKRHVSGAIRKPWRHKRDGHLYIDLYVGNVAHKRKIHRLVLEAFVGSAPEDSPQCRHLDGVPSNNNLDNLQWGTAQENADDMLRHGTRLHGEDHPQSLHTNEAVRQMREMYERGVTQTEIARVYNISHKRVWAIVHRKRYKHVN